MEEKNVQQIMQEIKGIDNNVTTVLIPILKDTIVDYRKIVFRLILIIIISILSLVSMSAYSIYKYNDFLSQFQFEGIEEVYTQDLDSGDGGDIVNTSINAGD